MPTGSSGNAARTARETRGAGGASHSESQTLGRMLEQVRRTSPLVHCISNYVTANDCANMLLACGASPVMADDPEDAVEITAICEALDINIGTLSCQTIPAMRAAGRRANELGHPVILDPVGAGASRLRTETALALMHELDLAVIRGNMSEIRTLALGSGSTRGVDADASERAREENLDAAVDFARGFSSRTGAVVAISGEIDVVTDGERAFCVRNGRPEMSKVTGTGCQLSALMGAFLASSPDMPLEAAAAATCAMGLCGELAWRRMGDLDGNASYRDYMIDAMCHLKAQDLEEGARYEVR